MKAHIFHNFLQPLEKLPVAVLKMWKMHVWTLWALITFEILVGQRKTDMFLEPFLTGFHFQPPKVILEQWFKSAQNVGLQPETSIKTYLKVWNFLSWLVFFCHYVFCCRHVIHSAVAVQLSLMNTLFYFLFFGVSLYDTLIKYIQTKGHEWHSRRR